MRCAWVGSLQADVERRASQGSKAVSEESLGSGTLTLEGRGHERENLLGREKVNASKVDKEPVKRQRLAIKIQGWCQQ